MILSVILATVFLLSLIFVTVFSATSKDTATNIQLTVGGSPRTWGINSTTTP